MPKVTRIGAKTMLSQNVLARKFLNVVCVSLIAAAWLQGCEKKGPRQKWSPHYRKAVRAYRQGEYAKAVSQFEKALLYDPSKAEIYLDIAAIYDDFLGNTSGAISYYEKYLRVADGGRKAKWVRRWIEQARKRLLSAEGQEQPGEAETDKDQLIETLREELRLTKQALADETDKTSSLSGRVSSLESELSTALKEKKELELRVASDSGDGRQPGRDKGQVGVSGSERSISSKERRPSPASWVLCGALGVVIVALIIKQRYAREKEKALLAGIESAASGSTEHIRKDDILGKYYWVENDHSAGILSFTEKDGDMHVCVIDGTTRLRSRGKGKLIGNVVTAELRSGSEESVVTKFIFANNGRTVTAVWQGDEGTSVAAGTKAVQE
ncbi:tetratricopeptide repeat protein [bacterium]|nr:tetratricopeptide repeat protein [bacterium]